MQLQVHTRHTCRKGPKVWAATWFLYMIGCRCPQGCASASTAQLALQLRVILAVCHLLFTSLPGRSGYIYIYFRMLKKAGIVLSVANEYIWIPICARKRLGSIDAMLNHKKETLSLPDNSSIIIPIPPRNHKHIVTRYISQAKPGSRFQNAFLLLLAIITSISATSSSA
jgi:hypothetical protein